MALFSSPTTELIESLAIHAVCRLGSEGTTNSGVGGASWGRGNCGPTSRTRPASPRGGQATSAAQCASWALGLRLSVWGHTSRATRVPEGRPVPLPRGCFLCGCRHTVPKTGALSVGFSHFTLAASLTFGLGASATAQVKREVRTVQVIRHLLGPRPFL